MLCDLGRIPVVNEEVRIVAAINSGPAGRATSLSTSLFWTTEAPTEPLTGQLAADNSAYELFIEKYPANRAERHDLAEK